MTFTTTHVYRFYIYCVAGGSTIYWQIDDVTAGTSQSGSTSTDVPAATTRFTLAAGIETIDATARTISPSKLYLELDAG